jgi:hypothetical protein
MLHVTNGESVAGTLRRTSLGGDVLSWNDVLHEGPLAFDPAESRPLRARFLAECGWGDEASILGELERRDGTLAGAQHVVLWFEHDLYDQLQLLQVLSQVREEQDVQLVQADEHLGPLDWDALELMWETRRPVDSETVEQARKAWRAVCTGEAVRDVSGLPYVAPALRRLAQERDPLPRTKRQLLEALAHGRQTPDVLFVANQEMENAAFLGDAWCFRFVHELVEEGLAQPVGHTLPEPPPRGDHEAFVSTPLELTSAGRAALAR